VSTTSAASFLANQALEAERDVEHQVLLL